MIITIDGPVATGKSTIAKQLANEIGFIYFDTGALYRCLTYGIMKHKIDIENPEALENFLKNFNFDIKSKQGQHSYFVDGEDVTLKIRRQEISAGVSKIAAISAVRQKLTKLQREMAEGVNAVFEGRDMGAEVFPKAELKIFLTGRPEVRAQRRLDELQMKFPEDDKKISLQEMIDEISLRDTLDSTREFSPLRKADDAFVIDTSDLTVDDIVYKILEQRDQMRINET